jgi:hypothetical protein
MPNQVPKSVGTWSVIQLRSWMVIQWASLLDPLNNIFLPTWVKSVLQYLFPPDQWEGIPVELVQVTTDFGKNEIPTALATVSAGRRADNTEIIAAIHYLTKHLKLFLRASVWCEGSVTDFTGTADPWPTTPDGQPKPFRVFDGYITGMARRKTANAIEYDLSLVHWLSDLNFSSTLSRSSSPQNPSQISYDPALPLYPNSGARDASLFRVGSPTSQAGAIINTNSVLLDLWGATTRVGDPANWPAAPEAGVGGMKQWLTELCLQDLINWRQVRFGSCAGTIPDEAGAKNTEALEALKKIEPLSKGYIDGVPLRMEERPGIQNIANQIATQIGFETPEVLHNHTIWDKLIGQYGSDLQFDLIPQVEKALIVPQNSGLRRPWVTIYANDYEYFEQYNNIPRPLRGIGLFVGREFGGGSGISLNNAPVYNTVGAYYENPNRRDGMVIWKKAPRWLSTVILPWMYQTGGQDTDIATSFDSSLGDPPDQKDPKCKFEDAKPLWCDYARALYIQEILRGRNGRLSGRLRFDIAPGSIIRIETPEEPFILEQMADPEGQPTRSYIYAQALRVSCVINVESQRAGTAIQFGFTRDEDENEDPSYSLDRHPIWACNWYGAPLVNENAFYPGGAPPGISPPECKILDIQSEECGGEGSLPSNISAGDGPKPPLPDDMGLA